MNVKIDIHNNHHFELKLDAVKDWKVPESTKKEIREFIDKAKIGQVQEGKRLSDRTLSKYLSLLKHSLEIINKPTSKITKEDVEKFDKQLAKEEKASAGNYRLCLQIFLKWNLGKEKAEKLTSWLDTKDKKKTPDYLSESEVLKLYKNCKSPSERFLIAVLFDSGARVEEFLNIRLEDIQLPENNESFVKLTLKEEYSKTNGRTISLYWKYSLESVRDYLKELKEEGIRMNEPVFKKNYGAVRMFLVRLGKKILNKEVSPHLFRHSSATYYASKLNRQELCYRYGWAFSSDMPDIYISRAGMVSKQLDEKFESTNIEQVEKKFEKERFETAKKLEEMQRRIDEALSPTQSAMYSTEEELFKDFKFRFDVRALKLNETDLRKKFEEEVLSKMTKVRDNPAIYLYSVMRA